LPEFGKLCRFWNISFVVLPRLFLVPGDGRTDGRPANRSHQKPPENRSNRRRQAAQPKHQSFSLSLTLSLTLSSRLLSSRPVPSATDPPRSLASLALSLSPSRSSVYCAARFPNPRALWWPGRAKFETRRFGSSFASSAAAPHPVVSELVSFFLRHPRPYSLVGTLPLLTLPWPIILPNCNALFWPTCSYNFSIHWVLQAVSSISLLFLSFPFPRSPPLTTFFSSVVYLLTA
jgi:hypothetical protein